MRSIDLAWSKLFANLIPDIRAIDVLTQFFQVWSNKLKFTASATYAIVLAAAFPVSASVNYTFTPVAVPGTNYTFAAGINDSGQIAGFSSASNSGAFLYSGGTFTSLAFYNAYGPNNAGQVVGNESTTGYVYGSGAYTKIMPPGATESYALAISNSGQIVGRATSTPAGSTAPVVYYYFLFSSGTYTTINLPGPPTGINVAGQIVGYYATSGTSLNGGAVDAAYLYSNGTYTTLPQAPGAGSGSYSGGTSASAINDAGQIVGSYSDASGTLHGFLYVDGSYATINVPGGSNTQINGINNHGLLVGQYQGSGAYPQAFVAMPAAPASGQLVNKQTDVCLDVNSISKAVGANIGQSACWGGANQIWSFTQLANGFYTISSVNSNLALDITGSSKNAGALTIQNTPSDGATSQQWNLQSNTDGSFTLVNGNSGQCLDGVATAAPYVESQQQVCSGVTTQDWFAVPLSNTTAVNLGPYYSVNAISTNGSTTINGGMDGGDDAFSSSTIGTTYNWYGYSFNIGPPNAQDAVTSVNVLLPNGQHNGLYFLATATNGAQTNQPFTVLYSDGTTYTAEQSINDWLASSASTLYPGEQIALTVRYRLFWNGVKDNRRFNLYGFQIPLDSAKTVLSIQLPKNPDVVVFAITLGK